MLSRKEREAVAGFRLWTRAFAQDDVRGMRQIERLWNDEDAAATRRAGYQNRTANGKLTMDQMRG